MNNYLGEIRMFGGNFAPKGWQMCNGQLLSIAQYSALFSLLGTSYGGNGTTNFGLPNMASRAPVHQGTGPGLSNYVLGETTGTENVTLLITELPAHGHSVNANSQAADQSTPGGFLPALSNDPAAGTVINSYIDKPGDSVMNPLMLQMAGGSQPHTNLQPLLAVTFIIALSGIFPSRN
ncbi:MAG: tail fiber protein [Bacteroidota bacterium]